MKESFSNNEGSILVSDLIKVIQKNKQILSDIDGAIGDGDHGINMNKGFTLCEQELEKSPGDLAHSLNVLSRVLVQDIGGSMGPLYGMFFMALADTCDNKETIDKHLFAAMLIAGETSVRDIGSAEVGDKTMLDTLVPAIKAYHAGLQEGKPFDELLDMMKDAAIIGRDSTKDLIARAGRASRLGERSRGFIDAGATSSCLVFESFADSIKKLLA